MAGTRVYDGSRLTECRGSKSFQETQGICGPILFRQVLDLQSTRVTHPQAFLESATPYAETTPGREEERCSWFQSQTCGLFTPFIPSCLPPPLFRDNYFYFSSIYKLLYFPEV